MARILYASQINELKGSIGGLSFQRNASGTVARLKPSKVQRLSKTQYDRNSMFAIAVKAWHALGLDHQELFVAYAAAHPKFNYWNEEKILSGYNMFLSMHCNAQMIGVTPLTHAPTYEAPDPVPAYTVNFGDNTASIQFDSPFSSLYSALVIYCSPPLLSIGSKNRSQMRLMTVSFDYPFTVIDFATQWKETFGFASIPDTNYNKFILKVGVATINYQTLINSPYRQVILDVNS